MRKGITVGEAIEYLSKCPKDATLLLNHCYGVPFEEDGKVTMHKAWVFDEILEIKCENIEDKERYSQWKSNGKLVWLTHQL